MQNETTLASNRETIDILSSAQYPANVLSNFYENSFTLDGVRCASMEGFLQSLKTRNIEKQRYVCSLCGKTAKKFFEHRWNNFFWKLTGTLYWQGKRIKRRSEAYQQLLDRAYAALSQNPVFVKALLDTEDATLIHSIGKSNARLTVLTEEEFVGRLIKIREELKKNQ